MSIHRSRALLAAASSFLFCAAAHAERITLDPITSVATRYERELSTTPASVTVLEADDIAPWAASPLEDILSRSAGVSLVRSGGPGQQVSVFLRGTASDSVLVLVDGVKVNGATFGGANLQNLRGADIARIEVVRGPRSTLYGSEAIGGVISITTRQATGDKGQFAVRASGGSDDTGELHANVSRVSGDSRLALGVGHYTTDGDPVTSNTTITGAHENTGGTLAAQTRIGDARVGVDAWAASGSTRYVDCVYDLFYNCVGTRALNQDFDNTVASLWGESALDDRTVLRARAGHAADLIEQRESTDFAQTRRLTGSIDVQRRDAGNTLVAGIDAEREDVDARIYGGNVIASINDNHALFARDTFTHGRHELALGVRAADYDSFGAHTTGEASYSAALDASTRAWIAWGRGFRAPDLTERFGASGNPALQPETTDSTEVGLRHIAGRHELSFTAFVQHIEDLIDYPAPLYTATNIARARIAGSELGWAWEREATRIDTFLTLQDPVDETTGEQLSRRPNQQLSGTARHRVGKFEGRAALLAMDERDNSAYDTIMLPGFAVVDIGLAWTAHPSLVIDARVDNVFDKRYVLASGSAGDYRMPDRAFFLGVEWRR